MPFDAIPDPYMTCLDLGFIGACNPISSPFSRHQALERKAAALKTAFNGAFIATNGAVCDGLCREVPHTAVHSTFYALAFGLVDAAHAPAAWVSLTWP